MCAFVRGQLVIREAEVLATHHLSLCLLSKQGFYSKWLDFSGSPLAAAMNRIILITLKKYLIEASLQS